jgi:thioredoxin reductase (NADPH)
VHLQPSDHYDALIIGGGPAGLSAAIYLARARRSVVVFDRVQPGRSDWSQHNQNYLGFPGGISITELKDRGRRQAERFGARFCAVELTDLRRTDSRFAATVDGGTIHGRAVILATGVTDQWVTFPGYEEFIGRSMHTCIVCDGYEMVGQRVMVAGNDEHAAEVARQLLAYDPASVTVVTNDEQLQIPEPAMQMLAASGINVIVDRIVTARAQERGCFTALELHGGAVVGVDHLFSLQGARPNSDLARTLGAATSAGGYIEVDTQARTNIADLYAAGDVTRLFSHLVLTAAHEGATAATTLNHDLYQAEREACARQLAGTA